MNVNRVSRIIRELTDKDLRVRKNAIEEINNIGKKEYKIIFDSLEKMLKFPESQLFTITTLGYMFRDGKTEEYRERAFNLLNTSRSLGILSVDDFIDLFIKAIDLKNEFMRKYICEAIFLVIEPRDLYGNLKGYRFSVIKMVIDALGYLDNPKIFELLELFLDNFFIPVRYATVEALGRRGEMKALEHLEKALYIERDETVKESIKKVIKKLTKGEPTWFEQFLQDPIFEENLSKLGEFEYNDEEFDESVLFAYWTVTRWKIAKIGGECYILSPAFWDDDEIQARFALICDPNFQLKVYVKKGKEEEIIGRIGCFKIIVEYDEKIRPSSLKKVRLSPKEELLATIQNLDYFFTEQIPIFPSFDYNIVHQALSLIISEGWASRKILEYRCEEIKEIILEILEKYDLDNEFNPQIYIQIKALLDFNTEKWIPDLCNKFELWKYLVKIIELEERDSKHKAAIAIGRLGGNEAIDSLLELLISNNTETVIFSIKALGELGNEKVIEPLYKIWMNKEHVLRWEAVVALGKLGDRRVLDSLIIKAENIDNVHFTDRACIIYALGDICNEKSKNSLEKALKSRYWDVRRAAVKSLGKMGSRDVIIPLLSGLSDNRNEVKRSTLETLFRMIFFNKEIVNELFPEAIEQIIQEMLKNKDQFVREFAAKVLGDVGDVKVGPPLIKALDDEVSYVRASSSISLVKLGYKNGIKPLRVALEKEYQLFVKKIMKKSIKKLNNGEKNWEGQLLFH